MDLELLWSWASDEHDDRSGRFFIPIEIVVVVVTQQQQQQQQQQLLTWALKATNDIGRVRLTNFNEISKWPLVGPT